MHVRILRATPAVMLTFGGEQTYTEGAGTFYGGDGVSVVTSNEHYTVIKSGLNHYVYVTKDIEVTDDVRKMYSTYQRGC